MQTRVAPPMKKPRWKARPDAAADRKPRRNPRRKLRAARPRETMTGVVIESTGAPGVPDRRIVVTALGVTQILAWGSSFYLLGVLANPVVRDTGWGYEWIMAGVS